MVVVGDNQLEGGYYGQLMVVLVTIMMKSTNESIVGGRMVVQQLVQGFHLPL